jgi:hypothetical protein
MSALTHVFLGKAMEVWRPTAPGIVVDCIEMDCISQERALLEGRIAVGLLVPTDRPLLELLQVRFLTKYSVKLALPKSHPEDGARMPVGAVWKPDSLIAPVQGRNTEGGVTSRSKKILPPSLECQAAPSKRDAWILLEGLMQIGS